MVPLILLSLACVAAGGVLTQDETSAPCTPGTVWTTADGCNTCFCLADGMPACSRMECGSRPAPDMRDYNDFFKPEPAPEPEPVDERTGVNCSLGETWQEQCNSCVCLEDGMAICTKAECAVDGSALAERVKERCQAGDTWADGCNVCHCVGGSQVVCSHGVCRSERRRRQAGCTPGSERRVACNTCFCMADGVEACSRRFCLQEQASSRAVGAGCAVQQCAADCGSKRGADGCLQCMCGPEPFFGSVPSVPEPLDSLWGGRWRSVGEK
ncbi:uncharacterized protein LOC119092017 [Pollicipes pollicipes]|uniref:uncharacterized protein LOC119092017 n=1 Tax=Pollicipes pollicipes TaxID=41117 RepID=UPI001884BF3F|nr:uncharacterized protein LOC119092017 [Pollicipes pollicipes]